MPILLLFSILDIPNKIKKKRAEYVMTQFMKNTTFIPIPGDNPQLEIKGDLHHYLPVEDATDIHLLWTAAIALFDGTIKQWFVDLIKPGLSVAVDMNIKHHKSDPYSLVFTYLSYGQTDLASEQAKEQDNYQMALYINHCRITDICYSVRKQINQFQSTTDWVSMTAYERKCWRVLCGDLNVVEDGDHLLKELSWQCIIGMFIWYSAPFQTEPSLKAYNKMIESNTTVAIPDSHCLWYQLLQWWVGDSSRASVDEWPIDFAWLLHLYKHTEDSDRWSEKWSEELERMNFAEWAICVSLISPRLQKDRLGYLLRQCEYTDENRLLKEYHISKRSILLGKALNAHDEWNFDLEYSYLLEGSLVKEAKMTLLGFVIPKNFNSMLEIFTSVFPLTHSILDTKPKIEHCLQFIDDYPDREDEDVQSLKKGLLYLLDSNQTTTKDDIIACLSHTIESYKDQLSAHHLLLDILRAVREK
ncbi:hypothetical protein BDB01DRAFT_782478 [Pilobolus umbonatus]|nr:hypothetical protein BDB01DRAFT_782478 [Pilobolus umbonatus]